MSHPQQGPGDGFGGLDLAGIEKIARRLAPFFAIAMVAIALPLAALYLTPAVLGLFAPPLDPGIDLYAVNRPSAMTFLDTQGREIGHRGAIVGKRLTLAEM